jgi:uncharacterized protein YjbI with pentapeptide repeats
MANMEHVQLVRRGRDIVARWREENPNEILDLKAAYMSYARIPQVNISGADLRDSDLMGAMLQRANLSGCRLNPCHLYHANLVQANLSKSLLNGANLRGANLSGADLSGADLDRAILSGANLSGAVLAGANLSRANLTEANLSEADLSEANLSRAALTRSDFTNARLHQSDLYEAVLCSPVLTGAKFEGSTVGYTIFQDCDLGVAEGLDQVIHDAPSTVGIDTVYRSGGQINERFLMGTGALESMIEFQRTLVPVPGSMDSCFISCSRQDRSFADALQADLRGLGVRCWLFSEDSRGNALVERHSTSDQEEVERGARAYDKLIVVGSQAALDSETVRNDINGAKERQLKEGQWVLYLVAPDDTVAQPRGRGFARNLSSEHIVFDLRGRDSDGEAYRRELSRLAENLGKNQTAAAGVPLYQNPG